MYFVHLYAMAVRKVLNYLYVFVAAIFLVCCGEYGHRQQPHQSDQRRKQSQIQKVPSPDPNRLLDHVRMQLRWGARIPGTPAHDSCRRWIVALLRQWCDRVVEQEFTVEVYAREYRCANIVAQLFPERSQRILLCAHWDSRPYADEDPLPSNRTLPVPGANDGASGVAVVLELIHLLRSHPLKHLGFDIALFDAEDMGLPHDADKFCLGSKHFAAQYPFTIRPRYGILFDLVGDRDAQFRIEQASYQAAPTLVDRIWKLGRLYGNGHFVEEIGSSIIDDHLSLIESGIPTVNIIDQELVGNQSHTPRRRYWHTTHDTIDNISGETMSAVDFVVLHLIYSDNPFPL